MTIVRQRGCGCAEYSRAIAALRKTICFLIKQDRLFAYHTTFAEPLVHSFRRGYTGTLHWLSTGVIAVIFKVFRPLLHRVPNTTHRQLRSDVALLALFQLAEFQVDT